jgi:hypothetical protein
MPSAAPSAHRTSWLLAVLLAVGAAAAHAGWLGWDHEYQLDPGTGVSSGPSEAWQVLGCAATVGALAAGAGLLRRPGLALIVVPAVFTTVWSLDAAPRDDSGLWAVGAVLVLLGSAAAVAAVAYLASVVPPWWDRRRS